MAQVNFRVDDDIKTQAESICKSMGLTMSGAINIFLAKLVNEQRIPFEVSADPFYDTKHIAILEKRIKEANKGVNMHQHNLIEDCE